MTNQVIEDIPIWENKAFATRLALADTDGPYMKFRKRALQFYAKGVEDGVDHFVPAPPDPRKAIEVVEHAGLQPPGTALSGRPPGPGAGSEIRGQLFAIGVRLRGGHPRANAWTVR